MNAELLAPRAILLDVGGTLLEERRFDLASGIRAVVRDFDRAADLAEEFRAEVIAQHLHHRELLLAHWLRDRVDTLQAQSVAAIEDAVWNAVVTLVPDSGAHRALGQPWTDGVPLAAVSNAAFSGRVLMSELARHGLAAPLRFVLSSADVGIRKPAASIFDAAVARLQIPASSTWFIGDTWNEDILGAREAGLQPLWFRGQEAEAGSVPVLRDWDDFTTCYAAARLRAPAG
jgi:putative hydrolase of the HAD superfamily